MATPRGLNRSYTAHPHGVRNVNNIHHTVCLVKGDGTTLDLNLQRRRPGKYDVPVTSKSFMKLDNENISRRLRARLCSASRVYCGNNMLNLHKQMYHKPRPASVQYKWSPQKVTLALPTIQKEKVRPKTAAVVRFHNTDSKSTSMRPKSYPWFGTTKQRAQEQEQEQEQQRQQHPQKEQQQQQKEELKVNNLDNDAAETSENGSKSKETDVSVVEKKDSPVHTDTGVSGSSESGSVQSRNQSNDKTEKKRKKRKKKKERKEEIEEDNEKRETVSSKMSADETETPYLDPRLSKRRGINSDDDYSTDISGDEEDRSV